MKVLNRSGTFEKLNLNKIKNRIVKLNEFKYITQDYIDQLTINVIKNLFDGIKTSEIDEETCRLLANDIVNPEAILLCSKLAIDNLHKETKELFSEKTNILKKYLHEDYYNFVIKNKDIIEETIDYDKDFKIQYFGFQTLKKSYLLHDNGIIIERPQDLFMREALGLNINNIEKALENYKYLSEHAFTHATPTLFNAGLIKPQFASCYLVAVEDNVEHMYKVVKDCANISKHAGGIGLHVSSIRAKNSIVNNHGKSKGIVPYLKVLNDTSMHINQCFASFTEIMTQKGLKKIKNIIPGDKVITYDNSYQKVLEVHKRDCNNEEILIINNNISPVYVTKTHQILVYDELTETENYISAEDIDLQKHYLIFNAPFAEDQKTNIEHNVLFFLGILYNLHATFISKNQFIIKIYNEFSKNILLSFSEFLDIKFLENNIYTIQINDNIDLNNFSEDRTLLSVIHNLYELKTSFEFPEEFYNFSNTEMLLFLKGFCMNSLYYNETEDSFLIDKFYNKYIHKRLFNLAIKSGVWIEKINNKLCITKKLIDNPLAFYKDKKIYYKNYTIKPTNFNGNVYDLTVENNHNYSTLSGIVHNSGKRQGSFACFVKGTEIFTYSGVKPIENIQEGDIVYTHKNNKQYVSQVHKNKVNNRNLYTVQIQHTEDIHVTDNHNFWVSVDKKNFQWMSVKHLKQYLDNNLVGTIYAKLPSNDILTRQSVNLLKFYALWYKYGFISADGNLNFILKQNKAIYLNDLLIKNYNLICEQNIEKGFYFFKIDYKPIKNSIKQIFGETGKDISSLFTWSASDIKIFIYYLQSNNQITDLNNSFYHLLRHNNILCKKLKHNKLQILNYNTKCLPIMNIKPYYTNDEYVYTLGVENDHSYTVNGGIVVENCYLEPWHGDTLDFLEMKLNTGHDNFRARDLFYALWIPDYFMECVEQDKDWYLMCPSQCPNLNEVYGDEFKELYLSYVKENKYTQKIKARDVWKKMIYSQIETGTPYMSYKDSANFKTNQKNIGTIKSSNLCVSGDTYILTKAGNLKIKYLKDTNIDVWNGYEWSNTTIKQTSLSSTLLKITFNNGLSISCTKYHKFYNYENEMIEAQNLQPNTRLLNVSYPFINSIIKEDIYLFLFGNTKINLKIKNNEVFFEYTISPETVKYYTLKLNEFGIFARFQKQSAFSSYLIISQDDCQRLFESCHCSDKDFEYVKKEYPLYVVSVENDFPGETYCFTEPKRNLGIFNGILTGNCNEIYQYSDENETSTCNLSSISLPYFIEYDNKNKPYFNFEKLGKICQLIVENLNNAIDNCYYPTPETKTSNMRHRPLGIGVQGLAYAYMKLNLPYESEEAYNLNLKIFECIYFNTLKTSNELAKIHGPYESFKGSPLSEGLFQFDLWKQVHPEINLEQKLSKDFDWENLRKSIIQYGVRNSLLTACMPTASTAQILNNSESIEPITSNIFTRRVLSGEYIIANPYFLDKYKNIWDENFKNDLIKNYGSVQNIPQVSVEDKKIFKTVWEIPQKVLINQSADRGLFIDQSQSLNLFIENPNFNKLTSMYFYTWKKGLKTGLYYLRSKSATNASQITINQNNIDKNKNENENKNENTDIQKLMCSINNPESCEMCSS